MSLTTAELHTEPTGLMTEAKRWLWFSLLYNLAEAVVSLWAAIPAKSIALWGFGLDSVIETAASAVVLWQLGKHASANVTRFIGLTFWGLAAYILVESSVSLAQRHAPEATVWGIVIGGLSVVIMPLVAWRKTRLGHQLHNALVVAEAKETLACGMMSATMLVGLALNHLFGWWWADPVAALCMIPWLYLEGKDAWQGQACCH
jgi:divalent metal cation (Fe/Co/Zn/Cd) transporter